MLRDNIDLKSLAALSQTKTVPEKIEASMNANGIRPEEKVTMNLRKVNRLWSKYFPDVPLTEPRWFEERDPIFLAEALAIAAKKDKKCPFKVRTQGHIGRYVNGVIRKLKKRATAGGVELEIPVVMSFGYRITDKDKARFKKKLVQAKDCLLFGGGVGSGEYGRFSSNGKLVGSHVFSYFAHQVGYLPADGELEELQVAHTPGCLSTRCCNPKHLRLTTRSVNLAERVQGLMKEGQPSKAVELAGALVGET